MKNKFKLTTKNLYLEAKSKEQLWDFDWSIFLKSDGTKIGSIGFMGTPNENCEVEIRCEIDGQYRKMGYATEAVKEMTDWAFTNDNVYFIMAEIALEDEASIHLLQKLNFDETRKQGETGSLFELERPASNFMSTYMSVGMCLGLSLGVALGSANDNVSLGLVCGIGPGMCLGFAIGTSMDKKDKEKRENLRKARNGETTNEKEN